MRIAFLSGPANGPETYRRWTSDAPQTYFGVDYFKQFLDLAKDAESHVITWHGTERYVEKLGPFTFDNRPQTFGSGIRYHLAQLRWSFGAALSFRRFKPDLLILTGSQGYWWPFAIVNTTYLPSFHCVLWKKFGHVSRLAKALLFLDRIFILSRCKVAVVTARDIGEQVQSISRAEVIYHLPVYNPAQFDSIRAPVWAKPFRVFFAARMEENKGVLDVVQIARNLERDRPGDFVFEFCGDGDSLAQAKAEAPANITFHGFCAQPAMKEIMSRCHAAIVPTKSNFEAGFEMTCSEAILSGRPLVTSAVCPALEYVREATIEVTPDDLAEYQAGLLALATDRALYEVKRAACEPLSAQFFDPLNTWLNAMKKALNRLGFGSRYSA